MTGNDVLEILNVLNAANIPVWIDGGWGIDALIGKQTREHEDLDFVVELEKVKDIIMKRINTISNCYRLTSVLNQRDNPVLSK